MIKILLLRAPGTNCDWETARALREAGASVNIMHTNKLLKDRIDIFKYHGIIFPGGFSYGDRVRAGAIWAKKLKAYTWNELMKYVESGYPILGICNGFQILVELGLLPGWNDESEPQVALAPNISARFEDRWVYLKHVNRGKCIFTGLVSEDAVLNMPVAHSEGRFLLNHKSSLKKLSSNDQIVFRYAKPDGKYADEEYPHNPNGSFYDIAAICNPLGNVLGIMPHPERAVYKWQLPNYTSLKYREKRDYYADGWYIFKSMIKYIVDRIN